MLMLTEKRTMVLKPLLAGQRVSRKYRQASIRRTEYRKLKAIVPSIAKKRKVSKVRVVEEAIKYIDELHRALFRRAPIIAGRFGTEVPSSSLQPQEFVAQLLQSASAVPSSPAPDMTSSSIVGTFPKKAVYTSLSPESCPLRPLQSSNGDNLRKL